MNSSICGADAKTHVKILATALLAVVVVIWVGLAARVTPLATSAPVSAGRSIVAMIESDRF
jgi:hypothetical protein